MGKQPEKIRRRLKRKRSIRKRVEGTATLPRLSVYRSLHHLYAQAIDDLEGVTLASASTMDKGLRGQLKGVKGLEVARAVGRLMAERCLEAEITQVVFDRNGCRYHGLIKALAEATREGGVKF